jgi:hypothetical protein
MSYICRLFLSVRWSAYAANIKTYCSQAQQTLRTTTSHLLYSFVVRPGNTKPFSPPVFNELYDTWTVAVSLTIMLVSYIIVSRRYLCFARYWFCLGNPGYAAIPWDPSLLPQV